MTTIVRPDRVYRTSVLTPIVGYQPQMSVQAVARQFTQGPPMGTTLQGLGYYGLQGPRLDSFKTRFRMFMCRVFGAKCAAAAADVAAATAITSGSAPIANTSPGPASMEASMVAPQMQSQMQLLSHLTQGSNGHVRGPLAQGMWVLAHRRPFTYYNAG